MLSPCESGEASLPKGQTTRKYDEAIHASNEICEKAWIASTLTGFRNDVPNLYLLISEQV